MRIESRSLFRPRARAAHRIEAKTDEATVYLYDEISWLGIQAGDLVKEIAQIEAPLINLRVNSPGGSVFDGLSIYNALKQHKSRVVAHVDGLAASIASVVVMGADEVRMAENAFLMVHEPYSIVIGDAATLREEADLLDKVATQIVGTYAARTGASKDQVREWMAAETWFAADEALDNGFVDSIDPNQSAKARVTFDLSAYAHVPEVLRAHGDPPTERDLEKALREAGCSRNQAKAIIAEGAKEQRDAAPAAPEAPEPPRDVAPPVKMDAVKALLAETDVFLAMTSTQHMGEAA